MHYYFCLWAVIAVLAVFCLDVHCFRIRKKRSAKTRVSRLTVIAARNSSNGSEQVKVDEDQQGGGSVAQCGGHNSSRCGFIHGAKTSSFVIGWEAVVRVLQEQSSPLFLICALGCIAIVCVCIHDVYDVYDWEPIRTSHLREDTNTPADDDGEPAFCYITYWTLRSQDPIGCWNPTEVGAEDGVQLAIVEDDTVERVPTTSICSHFNSSARSCKEWLNVREPFTVVNYAFNKIPTIEEVRQREAEFGKRRVFVGHPGWGGNCIVSKSIFKEFHASDEAQSAAARDTNPEMFHRSLGDAISQAMEDREVFRC